MPQYRGTPGPKCGIGWVGEGGRVWGTFGIALEMKIPNKNIKNKQTKNL
jgi:predicted sugar kinase